MVRSFNSGEFSELMSGRVDLDRYPSSAHRLVNFVAAPQGPAISRSGTEFMAPVYDETEAAALIPFVFSTVQAKIVEVAKGRIRFFDEDGLQVYAPVSADVTSVSGPLIITSPTLNASVGDEVVLGGFPAEDNVNGAPLRITAKAGNAYTLNMDMGSISALVGVTAARVYHISNPYNAAQRKSLRYVQSVDVMYLLAEDMQPRKLSRYGTYDWRLEVVAFTDGPYMPVNETTTRLFLSATGNAIPNMTSDTAPSGTCSGSGNSPGVADATSDGEIHPVTNRRVFWDLPESHFYYAFQPDENKYWASNNTQRGTLQYTPAAPFVCDGYTIYVANDGQDSDFSDKDYSPGNWVFQGYDGTSWADLDRQNDYVLYDGNKSKFFEINNETAYQAYRIVVTRLVRNGQMEARIGRLTMRSTASRNLTVTASGTTGINNDQGFLATDVGRSLRVKGTDGAWRELRITSYVSATEVGARLHGEPLPNLRGITDWRLGYWSNTTGWPSTGCFFEDRLWLGGSRDAPDLLCGSTVGGYEDFTQTDSLGEVLDDNAIVFRLNSRQLARIQWMAADNRGLLIGTGSEEYSLSSPNAEPLTAKNFKARPMTRRGSASVTPVQVDDQVLYVQRGGRTVREYAFVFEADGYRSPSMSQLASHIGAIPFVSMDYAPEPHSIVWMLRQDGELSGLTYNREESVIGWHRHDLAGAKVEAIAVLPQKDQLQDALWCVTLRTINGQQRRYIERLTRFWDFDMTVEDAFYVDCGLRYQGDSVDRLYGLTHLEGQEVYGWALTEENGVLPVGPLTVAGGSVELPHSATKAVLGLGYDSEVVLPRLENGAADGTAQGKVKRINSLVLSLWNSFGGEAGVWNAQAEDYVYDAIDYPADLTYMGSTSLYTGMTGQITPAAGYDMDGRVIVRRPKRDTLPFNIVAIMPQLNTQDR